MAEPATGSRGMSIFWTIWCGQAVSLIGSGLTAFALGVVVYQRTGSVTQFGIVSMFAVLPSVILGPVAGALVDRWNRRSALILSETGGGLTTCILLLVQYFSRLTMWEIYAAVGMNACFAAFRWPAFLAAMPLLASKEQLGRLNGLAQIAQASSRIVSPIVAGTLIIGVGLSGVLLADLVTFLVAVVSLLLVQIPAPKISRQSAGVKPETLLHEIRYGWSYLASHRGLFSLMVFFGLSNFLIGTVTVLATPMVLSFGSPAILGAVLTIGAVGLLAGGITMSVWGGPKTRIYGVLGFELLCGLALIAAGIKASPIVFAASAFLFFFSLQLINGSTMIILQTKVEAALQGRVFALCGMVAQASAPIAFLIAGPLADRVFGPLLSTDGALAHTVGHVIGVGPGRGLGLMFILAGFLTVLLTLGGFLYPEMRNLEKEMPDLVYAQ